MVVRRRLVLVAGVAFPLAMTAAGEAARAQAGTFTGPRSRSASSFPCAGGNADITARLLGEGLQRRFGQSVIVDNRQGAGGPVGQELVLQAPADGYTLVIGTTGTLYVSPLMAGKPSMLADFTRSACSAPCP